jgi:ferritin-like metal-binding protein YciE
VAEKKVEVVSQYVSDMRVLEAHIQEALEKQVGQTKDQPDINRAIQQYATTTKLHVERLERHLKALGDQDTIVDKAKGGISALFGIAAGAIDAVRTHQTSKNLRDNYTAASLAVIGYVMLRTTALACDDQTTAELAELHMGETIEMCQWIARTIPEAVIRDLQAERDIQLTPGVAQQVINDPKLSVLYGSTPGHTAAATTS